MTTETLLLSDLCSRRAWYSQRWGAPFLTPKEILYRAVEYGLSSTSEDAGEAAEAHAMDLCVDPGLDTAETDLLGLASHIASLANMLTWVLRGSGWAWKRPESMRMPNGSPWESGAFLSDTERHLRRVVLLDRWDAWAQLALERSWNVAGECSVYGVGIDCLIVEIGALRNGRWSNAFTVGYRHPVAKTLRFRKRDGKDFCSTWNKVEREHDTATREQWLDALTEDGILAEILHVHSVSAPERSVVALADSKLERLREAKETPEENLTACFDKIHPCPYRMCCPRGLEPSPEAGFVALTSSD